MPLEINYKGVVSAQEIKMTSDLEACPSSLCLRKLNDRLDPRRIATEIDAAFKSGM
jgi:hypothetical protein